MLLHRLQERQAFLSHSEYHNPLLPHLSFLFKKSAYTREAPNTFPIYFIGQNWATQTPLAIEEAGKNHYLIKRNGIAMTGLEKS